LKFQKTLYVPKIKTLDTIGVAQKFLFFAQKKILNHPSVIMQPLIQNFFINFIFIQY